MVPAGGHCFSLWNCTCSAPGCGGDLQGSSPQCEFTWDKYSSACIKSVPGEFLMLELGGGGILPAIQPFF